MTLQVGDRVVVFNAGTDYARAVKWDPPEVGDKVNVITLSDGTKCALPRLSLDVGDYVFVIPVWDNNFRLDGEPRWEMLSLGMCVFSITGRDCTYVEDRFREWEIDELQDFLFINVSLLQRIRDKSKYPTLYSDNDLMAINTWVVAGNSENRYSLKRADECVAPRDLGFDFGTAYWKEQTGVPLPTIVGTYYTEGTKVTVAAQQTCNIAGAVYVTFKIRGRVNWLVGSSAPSMRLNFTGIGASHTIWEYFGANFMIPNQRYIFDWNAPVGMNTNPSYPDYDTITINMPAEAISMWGNLPFNTEAYYYQCLLNITVILQDKFNYQPFQYVEIDDLCFYDANMNPFTEPCIGAHQVGDKYVIYDPVNKKMVANDTIKTVLASAYWRDVITPGETIELTEVTYAWDGQGHVYLTSSKTTFAQIGFHTQVRVAATAGGVTKEIAWHTGNQYTYDGVTASTELVYLNPILRAGNNTILVSCRDVDSTKIGFFAPVYIRRSMAALH